MTDLNFQRRDSYLPAPQIKFSEILKDLIESSSYRTNRREVWESVGITSAALSQYTMGRARPKFETLVALADFFGVSLDYLVLGRGSLQQSSNDSRSVARYVDWVLGDVQSQIGRRAWLTARVGQIVADRIEHFVGEVTETIPVGGMITTDEALILESYSKMTLVSDVRLDSNIITGENIESTIGRFGHVVAANLRSNPPRGYRFLLHEQPHRKLTRTVNELLRLLMTELHVPEERLQFCEFRRATEYVLVGSCYYQLDRQLLETEQPGLALAIGNYITSDDWMAFSVTDNAEAKAQFLIDANRIPSSLAAIKELWGKAEPFERQR